MTARPIRYQSRMSDRNGKIFYTSITSLSHISKGAITAADLDGFSDDLRDSLLTYIELRKRRENQ